MVYGLSIAGIVQGIPVRREYCREDDKVGFSGGIRPKERETGCRM